MVFRSTTFWIRDVRATAFHEWEQPIVSHNILNDSTVREPSINWTHTEISKSSTVASSFASSVPFAFMITQGSHGFLTVVIVSHVRRSCAVDAVPVFDSCSWPPPTAFSGTPCVSTTIECQLRIHRCFLCFTDVCARFQAFTLASSRNMFGPLCIIFPFRELESPGIYLLWFWW